MVRKATRRLGRMLGRDAERFCNVVLPAGDYRPCGERFQDNGFFLASAQAEAERLERWCGLAPYSRLLDVGCGVGRLAIGLLSRGGALAHYQGVDVAARSIAWCQRHITPRDSRFQFTHLDVGNERYNPAGARIGAEFRFPFADASFDIIYLYSVFSHMEQADVQAYLREFQRLLAPGGHIFLTAFAEEGVPAVTLNPADGTWQGPLHCVRYERGHLVGLAEASGLRLERFVYGQENDGQSALYLTHGEGQR